MITAKKIISVLFIVVAQSISLPCFAISDTEVDGLVSIYRRGHYAAAEALGQVLLEKDPANLRVRYYLANTYIKLGRPEEAEQHYLYCVEKGAGSKLAELSQTGLNRIQEARLPTTMPSSKRSMVLKALGAKDTRTMYERIAQQTERARQQLDKETEEARRKVYERYGIRPGANIAANYGGDLAREIAYIDSNYKRRLDDINERQVNLLSLTRAGRQRTSLMPLGSGMYVQNYVNYGDENDIVEIPAKPPLKAVAGTLSDNKTPAKLPEKRSSTNANKRAAVGRRPRK